MTPPPAAPPRVFLVAGGDRRIGRGHPWVYSNEIRMDAETKALAPGSLVALARVDGKPLGVGTFNPHCLVAFRLFSADPGAVIDGAFVAQRLHRALALRQRLFAEPFYRLVHAEGDGLPGLVVDRFGGVLSVQSGTAGMDALMAHVLAALDDLLEPQAVVLRNDSPARRLEGLETYVETMSGTVTGPVEVREGGLVFLADPLAGQKTGMFHDQRDNRAFVAGLAEGGRMLDVYCHGGGFALRAAAGGASSVLGIDSSEPALALARAAAARNGLDGRSEFVRGDAFDELAGLAAQGERFAVVAADPPAFVKSRKDLKSGAKGYRKLARLSAALVAPEGFLFLASCSHNLGWSLFLDEVAIGVARAGRSGRIIRTAGAGPDHPVHPNLPETAYLKAVVMHLD